MRLPLLGHKGGLIPGWLSVENLITNRQKWDDELLAFVRPFFQDLVWTAANAGMEQIGVAGSFGITNPSTVDWVDHYSYKFATKINDSTEEAIGQAITSAFNDGLTLDELATLVQAALDPSSEAAGYRAEMVAQTEFSRASKRGQLLGWQAAGVVSKVWRTSPDCCDFCAAMDGKVIAVHEVYAQPGDEIQSANPDSEAVFRVSDYDTMDIAELHPWCRCESEPVFEAA